jgi:flavin reductase (DIM6/NTAB) family NADH-FMN oxidoreductase RutF
MTGVQAEFREVMAGVCSPVAVVTTMADGIPHGTTVSAFMSLSMEPPMVLVSLNRDSDLLAMIRKSGYFGLNVLSSGQAALAARFARKGGAGKFSGLRWDPEAGVPHLPGVGGFLVSDVTAYIEGGDHIILLGLVRAAHATPAPPLTYHARVFGTHVASVKATG